MDMLVTYPQPSLENLASTTKVWITFRTDSKDPCLKKRITLLKHSAKKQTGAD
jgi:hypothetical protein